MTYENHQPRPGGPVDDEEERDDDADCHPNFDTPDYRQREGEEHEREVDPCSHPVVKRRVKGVQCWSKDQIDLQ